MRRRRRFKRRPHVPLNAAEGFIRQVLGWREFIRGVYWLHMPGYGGAQCAWRQTRKLPWFYWSGETRMNCVHQVVQGYRGGTPMRIIFSG